MLLAVARWCDADDGLERFDEVGVVVESGGDCDVGHQPVGRLKENTRRIDACAGDVSRRGAFPALKKAAFRRAASLGDSGGRSSRLKSVVSMELLFSFITIRRETSRQGVLLLRSSRLSDAAS